MDTSKPKIVGYSFIHTAKERRQTFKTLFAFVSQSIRYFRSPILPVVFKQKCFSLPIIWSNSKDFCLIHTIFSGMQMYMNSELCFSEWNSIKQIEERKKVSKI